MHAHTMVIREPHKVAVFTTFRDHRGDLRTVPIIVTGSAHAARIVSAMNAAPATGNFPAVLAAVGAR